MSSKSEKADAIKDHAIHGRFYEIGEKFGEKASIKGREYAASKLLALRNKIKAGEDINGQKIATPFMLFALDIEELQDMEQLEHRFKQSTTENADQSDDLDSVTTQPQQAQMVVLPETVQEKNILTASEIEKRDDQSAACVSMTQPEEILLIDPAIAAEDVSLQVAITTKKSGFQIPKSQGEVTRSQVSPENFAESAIKRSGKESNAKSRLPRSSVISKSAKSRPSKFGAKIERKVKKNDFPNAPIMPKKAHEYFMEGAREDAKAEVPTLTASEITKELKIVWKSLTADERITYEEKLIAEKERYEEEMCQYRKNYSEEAEEYRLATKTKAKASAKASFRLSNNHDYDEGSNEDEQANSDQDGEVDTSKDDSADHKIFDDEGIKNKISRKSAKISNSEGNPRQSTASISGSSPQSRKRLLSTSSKRSSKKVTPQRNFSLTSTSKKINKKSDTPLRSQPEVPYIDSEAHAARTAKIVSALKGIKSEDLPISEDIQRTKTVPIEKCSFPEDFIPSKGDKVTLILEPYREFISELKIALLTSIDLELAQATCLLTSAIAHATVVESRLLEEPNEEQILIKGYRSVQILVLKIGSEQHTIVYMPFSSPLLHTEVYLLNRQKFSKSLAASWLIPNAQVRRLFSVPSGLVCEWQEGSIYHVTSDMKTNPFASISVVWMQLEQNPRFWFYSYEQLDNLCSPWDLELSQYVLPENIRMMPLPRSLAVGKITAKAVINYLQSFDFSSVFMYNLTGTKEFCDMFPNMEDRLDLHEINRRCKRGKYEETSGLTSLFEDLTLMCTNGKKFNSGNVGFQPWVMVDMMEKTLSNILLSQKGSLTQFNRGCIISSATASSSLSQSHRSNGQQTCSNVDDDPFEEEDNEVRSTMLNDLDQEEFTQEV